MVGVCTCFVYVCVVCVCVVGVMDYFAMMISLLVGTISLNLKSKACLQRLIEISGGEVACMRAGSIDGGHCGFCVLFCLYMALVVFMM